MIPALAVVVVGMLAIIVVSSRSRRRMRDADLGGRRRQRASTRPARAARADAGPASADVAC